MLRTNIYIEERQHRELLALAGPEPRKVASIIREMIDEGIQARKRRQWEQAAQLMANEYASDKELTAFTALDGEDFIE